jgi:hypothetical protein
MEGGSAFVLFVFGGICCAIDVAVDCAWFLAGARSTSNRSATTFSLLFRVVDYGEKKKKVNL